MSILENHDAIKYTLDTVSVLTVVGVWAQVLPWIASIFTIVWCGLQIFDWIERRLERRRNEKDTRT